MVHHLGQGAAQAVQARNHHDIAGLEAREQIVQLRLLVAMLQAGPLFDDLLASCFGQRAALRGGRNLVAGTVPKVADQHRAMPFDEPWFKQELLGCRLSGRECHVPQTQVQRLPCGPRR